MASNSYKNPPKFDESTSYETWKNEIEIWKLMTELPKKKQALAVSLLLGGTARQTALDISADDLNKDDGMNTLITALDGVFQKERKDCGYEAYSMFDTYRKSDETSMTDFIVQFEQHYTKCKKYDMVLPDAVLAFKLLDEANLNVKERQLALTACNGLTFMDMKSALKRVFGETVSNNSSDAAITVKQEKVYVGTSQKTYTGNQRSSSSYRSAPKWQTNQPQGQYRPSPSTTSASSKKTNPLNRYGYPTKCAVCQSIYHWAKKCPDKAESAKVVEHEERDTHVENCNFTLFTNDNGIDHEIFVNEAFGSAVIDTACTKTVCGEKWMNMYLKMLNDEGQKNVCTSKSAQSFKFGDGEVMDSFLNVTIPAKIGSKVCKIETEVVKSDIPLLLHQAHNCISDVKILRQFQTSDHFPLCISINVPSVPQFDVDCDNSARVCKWLLADEHCRASYNMETDMLLNDIVIPADLLYCSDCHCNNLQHHTDIDTLYCNLVTSLNHAADKFIPHSGNSNAHNIPGWNEFVKAAHDEARRAFKLWASVSKPKQGPFFSKYAVHQSSLQV